MLQLKGTAVSQGIVIGPAFWLKRTGGEKITAPTERERLDIGLKQLQAELAEEIEKVSATDEATGELLTIEANILDDEELLDSIRDKIANDKLTAEQAAKDSGTEWAAVFSAMDDEYMQARAADVQNAMRRLAALLSGEGKVISPTVPAILLADDLAPAELLAIDREKILGICLSNGNATGHTAILAGNLGLPMLINLGEGLANAAADELMICDAKQGLAVVAPNAGVLQTARAVWEKEIAGQERRQQLKDLPARTKDGRQTELWANIAGPQDLPLVLENGATGIGLFRSEFLYLSRAELPSEEEQLAAYRAVAEGMVGKPVVIRTMDIGADKQTDCLPLPAEPNPALGRRAIRICLEDTELFRTQLRALLRAAVFGDIRIMYPMITSLKEIQDIKEQVKLAAAELIERGEKYRLPPQGIMIETPAAALISDELAKAVDFFSIGTNDLTQYTLALDRQAGGLNRFYDPHHPAVLQLIGMAAQNAHAAGITIGICGELAADKDLSDFFLNLGIDELSVSPKKIPGLKEHICNL